jgi:hypothetical protein
MFVSRPDHGVPRNRLTGFIWFAAAIDCIFSRAESEMAFERFDASAELFDFDLE